MARIFITGSADGLGQLAAKSLVDKGHHVVLHARNADRGREAMQNVPGAETVLTADLSLMDETIKLAHDLNQYGSFDAVIHNAGVYQAPSKKIFAVNTIAPYILTCLIQKPARLIYLSSGMHRQGRPKFEAFSWDTEGISYSDSKLHVLLLSMAVAGKWQGVYSNALDPGWVPTKMGGKGAPDDLTKGYETQVWLSVSDDPNAKVSGKYFYHQTESSYSPLADDIALQNKFLQQCEAITGISFP